jgi:uncharacterized membrane protein
MRLFGHPVHPILVTFPVSLFCLGPICDVLASLGILAALAPVGRLCLIVGLAASGPALITGFWDFVRLDRSSPATRTAVWHGLLAFSAASSFALALAVRGPGAPSGLALALELLGAALILATGWFGGHLVFHFGLGVRDRERPREK